MKLRQGGLRKKPQLCPRGSFVPESRNKARRLSLTTPVGIPADFHVRMGQNESIQMEKGGNKTVFANGMIIFSKPLKNLLPSQNYQGW